MCHTPTSNINYLNIFMSVYNLVNCYHKAVIISPCTSISTQLLAKQKSIIICFFQLANYLSTTVLKLYYYSLHVQPCFYII